METASREELSYRVCKPRERSLKSSRIQIEEQVKAGVA